MIRRTTQQTLVTVRVFTQRFSSTPLGARLARHLALHQLHTWGVPHGSALSDTAALLVAELTANAATHGRVPGRDFELRLGLSPSTLRVEVSDTRGERRPPAPGDVTEPSPLSTSGRGLLIVQTVCDRWAVLDRVPVGKTVVAEIDLPTRTMSGG
ncbi:ATP-binding protein [Streptomyces sp. TRM 70351]|uniref:ATP-binding protein n=1 Tax=Streptomyces sp. TRM 70351 TaxID=3116552 RepID=UPI002E7B6D84|nr:ATP-binding protein [Streptomyces sp. TRM 70351]MEE1928307.1 ATP-binding protein [Streptomyces sp. TRM 70351]